MADLREQLQQDLQGSVCLMGLGNPDYGDDGLGVRLAEDVTKTLKAAGGLPGGLEVIITGARPEYFIGRVAEKGFDHLVLLDAVEFGGTPGSVILLNSEQMVARFPQISTHKISLGLLATRVEADGATKAWLLGVQPESLKGAGRLTPTVQKSLEALNDLLCKIWGRGNSETLQQEPVGRSIAEVDLC
jgi:hydrogenase maturation protease